MPCARILSILATFTLHADNKIVNMEDLSVQQLESELKTVVDWFQFGVAVGIPTDILRAIRADRHDTSERRLELFMKWKDRERPTWPKVIKALYTIGLKRLADELSVKYCGPNAHVQESEPPLIDYSRLPKIMKYLHEIPMKDQINLGLLLGLDYTRLMKLREQQPTEFLREMVAALLRGEDKVKSTSWATLAAALRDDMVGQTGIAAKIESNEDLSSGT